MATQKPTVGRIVHYKLSAADAEAINRRRGHADAHKHLSLGEGTVRAATGEQVHTGNAVSTGDVLPLLVTRTWDHGLSDSTPILVNGQVFLDGNDSLWVTSVVEGGNSGQYEWPTIAKAA